MTIITNTATDRTSARRGVKPRRASGAQRASLERSGRARSDRVQRYTGYASTAGQRGKRGGLTAEHLAQMDRLQEQGYALVGKNQRVKDCGTIPVVGGRVALGVTGTGVSCSGLWRCGSRWCPHCWGKVRSHRSEEILEVASWASAQDYQIVLATLTAAHVTTQTLEECGGDLRTALEKQQVKQLFDGLQGAWRAMTSGRGAQELKRGWVGYARAFELTTDSLRVKKLTGTHGHFHVMLVLEKGCDLQEQENLLWERWQHGCAKFGLETSGKGFDFKALELGDRAAVQAAASYMTKGEKISESFAKSIGQELTNSQVKGGFARVSPEALLREIGALDPATDQVLLRVGMAKWRGIEEACRGKRWLTWSRDLRKLAGLGEELTDEEIAMSEAPIESESVAVVLWEEIRDHLDDIRAALKGVPERTRWSALILALDSLGIAWEEMEALAWSELMRAHMAKRRRVAF